jgi:hypothetical protein
MSQKDHAIERLCDFLRDAIEHWDWLAEHSKNAKCPPICTRDWGGMSETSKLRASVARKLIAEAEAATKFPAN